MIEKKIGQNDAGQRLDKYLTKAYPALPQSLLYKYIRLKRIKVNGGRTQRDYRLGPGDTLQLYINDELLSPARQENAFLQMEPDLTIVYEDMNLILADKPPGLLVHEDEGGDANTLLNRIKAHLYRAGEWDPGAADTFAPSLCNRIDRNTGGIVIAAKNAQSLRILNDKIRDREISKYYLCLAHGVFRKKEGVLTHYLTRDRQEKQVALSHRPVPGGLTAKTEYTVLEQRGEIALVECRLVTGRTHQIRAQMAQVGHPLVGDTKYGTLRRNQNMPFAHQALYSYKLRFDFPTDAGLLSYLKGHSYRVRYVPFLPWFESLPKR